MELGALQVTALGIRDLIGRRAPFHLARHEVSERDSPIRQRVTVFAAAPAAIAILILLWACLIGDVLGVGGKLGMADGRWRVAEPQIDVDSLQTLRVGFAAAANDDDVGPFFEEASGGDLQ